MKTFKPQLILIIVIPILLGILSYQKKIERTNYHMYDTDPEYAYLFNGLNICNFSSPAHVQGPGTPSQMTSALVIRTVYLFRSTSDSLNVDVMKNPDVYCSAINTFTNLLLIVVLLLSGFLITQATGNIFTGLFFQLIPLTKWILLDLNSRIMVETMVIIGVVILSTLVIVFLNDPKVDHSKRFDKYLIGFSLLIGFIASSKLVYVPVALFPFFIIQGAKRRISYIWMSVVAFFLFSFSVFFYWVPFRDWYLDNFFHSGMYGAGQTSVIDWSIFKDNLNFIFIKDKFYLITFLANLVLLMIYFIPGLKLKRKNDKEFLTLLGIFLVLLIMTLLVSKQFKEYYMVINYLLMIPSWYFILKIISRPLRFVSFNIIQIAALVILGYFVYTDGPKLILEYHPFRMAHDKQFQQSLRYAEENKISDRPTLVLPNYFGTPFKEYGLFYGMAWCGSKMSNVYAKDLNQLHPYIYFFQGWNNSFNQWCSSFSFIELMKKYGTITFYSGDKTWEESLKTKLKGINRQLDTRWNLTKSFDDLQQSFYEVKYDSLAAKIERYDCDAETTDETGSVFINALGQKFEGTSHRNNEYSKSGNYSEKLMKDQYGFTCALSEVQKGEHYQIEIWRKEGNQNSALVVQSAGQNEFYLNTTKAVGSEAGWKKLILDITISDNLHNKDIKVYCWNFDDSEPAYFDDLSIIRVK